MEGPAGVVDHHLEETANHLAEVVDHLQEGVDHLAEVVDHLQEVVDHSAEVVDHLQEVGGHPVEAGALLTPRTAEAFQGILRAEMWLLESLWGRAKTGPSQRTALVAIWVIRSDRANEKWLLHSGFCMTVCSVC